jgi:hypothetical protein
LEWVHAHHCIKLMQLSQLFKELMRQDQVFLVKLCGFRLPLFPSRERALFAGQPLHTLGGSRQHRPIECLVFRY